MIALSIILGIAITILFFAVLQITIVLFDKYYDAIINGLLVLLIILLVAFSSTLAYLIMTALINN